MHAVITWMVIAGIPFAALVAALACRAPPRPPVPAAAICDVMEATRERPAWDDDCGCRVRLGTAGTPYLDECPAHEAMGEVEATREQA
jgi:hypothetical protein